MLVDLLLSEINPLLAKFRASLAKFDAACPPVVTTELEDKDNKSNNFDPFTTPTPAESKRDEAKELSSVDFRDLSDDLDKIEQLENDASNKSSQTGTGQKSAQSSMLDLSNLNLYKVVEQEPFKHPNSKAVDEEETDNATIIETNSLSKDEKIVEAEVEVFETDAPVHNTDAAETEVLETDASICNTDANVPVHNTDAAEAEVFETDASSNNIDAASSVNDVEEIEPSSNSSNKTIVVDPVFQAGDGEKVESEEDDYNYAPDLSQEERKKMAAATCRAKKDICHKELEAASKLYNKM